MNKSDKIKRRHIRFKPTFPKRVIVHIKFEDTTNESTIIGYIEGIVYDISLGEIGIVFPHNMFKKDDKIDIKLENYNCIKDCTIVRIEKDFIAIRFKMNDANNNIVLSFIQDNLENINTGE